MASPICLIFFVLLCVVRLPSSRPQQTSDPRRGEEICPDRSAGPMWTDERGASAEHQRQRHELLLAELFSAVQQLAEHSKTIQQQFTAHNKTIQQIAERTETIQQQFASHNENIQQQLASHNEIIQQQLASHNDAIQQQLANRTETILQQLACAQHNETVQQRQEQLAGDLKDEALKLGCDELVGKPVTSGVYEFNLTGVPRFSGYCDLTTVPSTGWLVFQRRKDGSKDFYRNWTDYMQGFGNPSREFWLGNDRLYELTSRARYRLRVDLADANGTKRFAEFDNFKVASEADKYKMTYSIASSNNLTSSADNFHINNGRYFSTPDRDNDASSSHCAQRHAGAWWYGDCTHVNLNGRYDSTSYPTNVRWWGAFANDCRSLKFTEMKLRRVANNCTIHCA